MAEKTDGRRSPEAEDNSYIRSAVTLGNIDIVKDWFKIQDHDKAEVNDKVLIPSAMYGRLDLLEYTRHGDVLMKDTNPKYKGWTLMHFAVEGAQRVVVMNQPGDEQEQEQRPCNVQRDRYLNDKQPSSVEEVRWKQMDIIMKLYGSGVPPAMEDENGDTASDRACRRLEDPFLEGAMLLDILTILDSRQRGASGDTTHIETPGLSCIPSGRGWKRAIQQLIEWAYHRNHYQILHFCQKKKYTNLSSPDLLLTSTEFSLRQHRRPLLMDAILTNNFPVVKIVLTLSSSRHEIVSRMYQYSVANAHKKDSILSYACSEYSNSRPGVLNSLLCKEVVGVHLTTINLSGAGVRNLPIALFHRNLQTLDVRENILLSFPSASLEQNRLGWDCPQLDILNFSHNNFVDIPADIFKLQSLTRLIASSNKIKCLPIEMWTAPALKVLDLSDNQIQYLPCHHPQVRLQLGPFHTPSMSFAQCQPNQSARVYLNQAVPLESAKHSYVNYDIDSSQLHRGQVGFGLQTLDLTGNQLIEIPRSLPCLAPLLHILRVAKNRITKLGQAADYPPLLQTLDVKNNGITSCIEPSFESPHITCVQSQVAQGSPVCSHVSHQRLTNLKFLYLSSNRLEEIQIEYTVPELEFNSSQSLPTNSLTPGAPSLLYPRLQGLRISNNRLTQLPDNIHRLEKLCELAFDGNPGIERLPEGLHRLSSLFTLRYEGIRDPVVQELTNFKNAPEILYYLKARECQACVNRSMRLFVIGHFCKGKTTLLEALKGNVRKPGVMNSFDTRFRRITQEPDKLSPEEIGSTVGIECGKWVCSLKRKHASRNATRISFYTWDFAGQEEYYVTHQCFLTNRALYLLVWNVEDGQKGINSLSVWLQNMQARAQGFSHNVIVVGTHLDKIPRHERDQKRRMWTQQLEQYSAGRTNSRVFPKIAAVVFVGCPPGKARFLDVDVLNDVIYDTAMEMKSPKDFSSVSIGLNINILEEKIPQTYDQLRVRIEEMAVEIKAHGRPPVLQKADFCDKVQDIITGEKEVETAVDFLHTTTGVVLHFKLPLVTEYYIIDPQRWFDLCALVIAPDNVSKLVQNAGRIGDDKYGLLSCKNMNEAFETQGCDSNISKLIRTFLCQFHIIHQVSKEYCLVPSAISSVPAIPKKEELGSFPKKAQYLYQVRVNRPDPSLPSVLPMACNSPEEVQLKISNTGLIYRRFMLLPPIASGFWSKLIALFLQKKDFNDIVTDATPSNLSLKSMGPAHRLRAHIGNLELSWRFWKTGIMLYIGEEVALRVNSFQSHEFEDPLLQNSVTPSLFASRQERLTHFAYKSEDGYQTVPDHYKEVIEIVVPEIQIDGVNAGNLGESSCSHPLSAKLLTKALEIIDEVVKNHCEHLAVIGIYSRNDMRHVIPCPLCFGDNDQRVQEDARGGLEDSTSLSLGSLSTRLTGLSPLSPLSPLSGGGLLTNGDHQGDEEEQEVAEVIDQLEASQASQGEPELNLPEGSLPVFTVEAIIKETFSSDVVKCPNHGSIEIESIAPDLVFADLVNVKLDKSKFSAQIDKDEEPVARGSFGKVFRNTLYTDDGELDVAVKVFEQPDNGMNDTVSEITRSYADMRYELNKLSTLKHPYIVKFIGVLTNPHCFVLEWAPLKSLEHLRADHSQKQTPFCAGSIFEVLVQVTSALAYLHSPHKVGIVHRDLRCSNILVFKFPDAGHNCYEGSKYTNCKVYIKLTDMGICANPLAYKVGGIDGLKQYVPECLSTNSGSTLTEKIDIFCLGSCLYELMTLRGLPPSDIGEPEYKNMLQSGKRAQFHAKDPSYPLYLFQTLEDCWQHEHFNRPSADQLCAALLKLTGITVERHPDTEHTGRELQPLLVDSYTLHPEKRIARTQSNCTEGSLEMCVALSTRDDLASTVATVKYKADVRTELHVETSGTIKNNTVLALHCTTDGNIFVGCEDGTLTFYDSSHVKYQTNPSESCSTGILHGDIIKIFYDPATSLLIVGFSSGRIHIEKCTQGVVKSINSASQWRVCCGTLREGLPLHSFECILTGSPDATQIMEIWYGSNSNTIEVWSLPVSPSISWSTETVEKSRQICHIRLPGSELNTLEEAVHYHDFSSSLKVSEDGSKVVIVLQSSGRRVTSLVAIVDVSSKACLKCFNWNQSVACVLLTSRKLALGTFNGEVYVFDSAKLMEADVVLQQSQYAVLRAHKPKSRIYSLTCVKGHIGMDGNTSYFPTYVGRCDSDVAKDFLVTVGYGREYMDIGGSHSKVFKSFLRKEGTFVNVWLL